MGDCEGTKKVEEKCGSDCEERVPGEQIVVDDQERKGAGGIYFKICGSGKYINALGEELT